MKLIIPLLLLSLLTSSVFALEHDANQNFASIAYDIKPDLFISEKPMTDSSTFAIAKERFDHFTTHRSTPYTLEQIKSYSMPQLITDIVKQLNQHGQMIDNKLRVLSSFTQDKPLFDCDVSSVTVYDIVYKIQKKFPHYKILPLFHLAEIKGHMLAAIESHNGMLYVDLNTENNLQFLSEADYRHQKNLGDAKLVHFNGESIKGALLWNLASHQYMMEDFKTAKKTLATAVSFLPNNINIWLLQAQVMERLCYESQAAIACQKVYELDKQAVDYYMWIRALVKTGGHVKALKLIEAKLKENGVKSQELTELYFMKAYAHHGLAKELNKLGIPKSFLLHYMTTALESYELAHQKSQQAFHDEISKLTKLAKKNGRKTQFEAALEMFRVAQTINNASFLTGYDTFLKAHGLNIEDAFKLTSHSSMSSSDDSDDPDLSELMTQYKALQKNQFDQRFDKLMEIGNAYKPILMKHVTLQEQLDRKIYRYLVNKAGFSVAERFVNHAGLLESLRLGRQIDLFVELAKTARKQS